MATPQILAIIPARGGSKGIPRKNLKEVGGKPLVVHAVEQAFASAHINQVLVSTEDEEIRQVALAAGAETMGRSEEFIHDNTIQEVDRLLIWTIKNLEKAGRTIDYVVLLYPTAPLRRTGTIDEAISKVLQEGYDSCLSLYEDKTYLWEVEENGSARPTNYDPKTRGPRQKESWNQWAENKAVYVMKRDLLVETGCRLGGRIGWVEMDRLESIDVDRPEDLELCRMLVRMRQTGQSV